MQLFPERARRSPRLLTIAAILSLLLHLCGGALWPLGQRTFAHALPAERVVANIDPITIDVARPAPTPRPTAVPAKRAPEHDRPAPAHHRLDHALVAPAIAVPMLAPLPPRTVAHARVLAYRPAAPHAIAPPASRTVLTPDQIASYEGAFRRTIAESRAAANGTGRGSGASTGAASRTEEILGGTPGESIDFGGLCHDYAPVTTRSGYHYHYLTCRVTYSDGFSELTPYPWPFRFPAAADPLNVNGAHFPEATPPPGFVLPPDFEPSRRVCAFFHDVCVAKLAPERRSAVAP